MIDGEILVLVTKVFIVDHFRMVVSLHIIGRV